MKPIQPLNSQAVSAPIQNTLLQRFIQMTIGWGTVGLVYLGLGWRQVEAAVLPELWLDQQLAFTPNAIWVYLSFFIFIPYTYITIPAERLLRLRYAMQISAVVSGVIFFVLPTQLNYPEVVGEGASIALLKMLMASDTPQNCLPSLHAALSLMCVVALFDKQRMVKSLLIAGVGLAICVSILQLRRHLTIDISAGLVLGTFAYYVSLPLANAFKKSR